jgi:short-subunit dehydrogenase
MSSIGVGRSGPQPSERENLNGTGIRVMLASFAKVASSYWENNPGSEERLPKVQSMVRVLTPEEAAQAIIGGIKRDKQKVVAPFSLRCVFALNRYFPNTTRRIMSFSSYRAGGRTRLEDIRR